MVEVGVVEYFGRYWPAGTTAFFEGADKVSLILSEGATEKLLKGTRIFAGEAKAPISVVFSSDRFHDVAKLLTAEG